MGFGWIVSLVVDAFVPVHKGLFFGEWITEPMKPHIPRFRTFLGDIILYKGICSSVINFNWSGWLWMSKYNEKTTERNGSFCIVKKCTNFGFSSRGYHMFDSFTFY